MGVPLYTQVVTTTLIDKSWLHSPGNLDSLEDNRQFFLSHILFYEVLTTTPKERARCFGNLQRLEPSLLLLPGLGTLLRYEAATSQPCIPLEDRRAHESFSIHPDANNPDFPITASQQRFLKSYTNEREVEEVSEFKHCCVAVTGWFPILKDVQPGGPRDVVDPLIEAVATNQQMIRDRYAEIRHPGMPAPNLIDSCWAFYRRMQVNLLAGIDFIWRYGHTADFESKKLPNQYLDLEYLILATLAGSFATRETRLRDWFMRLRPDGELVPA